MKSLRLALLLFAVFAAAALAGPGIMSLSGDSGDLLCPAPETPAPVPTPDAPGASSEDEEEPEDCNETEDPDAGEDPDIDDGETLGDTDTPDGGGDTPEDSEKINHGQIVSTIAHCAPRGKDPLFEALEGLRNHGAFVREAAHGEKLSVNGVDYELSTLAGAEALCTGLDALAASLDPADGDDDVEEEATDDSKDKRKKHKNKHKKSRKHGRH